MTTLSIIAQQSGYDDTQTANDSTGMWHTSDLRLGYEFAIDEMDHFYHPAFRFTNVTIPQGATVTSATLTVTRPTNWTGTIGPTTLYGDDVDNSTNLGAAHRPTSGWTNTTASTALASIATGSANTQYSVDVTAIVQEIIARAGWASGNALSIDWKAGATCANFVNIASATHVTTEYRPALSVEYTTGGGGQGTAQIDLSDATDALATAAITSVAAATLTEGADQITVTAQATGTQSVTVTADVDDGFEDNNAWSNSGTSLGVGNYNDGTLHVYSWATRFPNLTIPQGATINSAQLQFVCQSSWMLADNSTVVDIYGDNVDNSTALSDTHRPHAGWVNTTASLSLSLPKQAINSSVSFDIIEIIQEIVSRPGWASGNSCSVMIAGRPNNTNNFAVYSANVPAYCPKLVVSYTPASGTVEGAVSLTDANDGATLVGFTTSIATASLSDANDVATIDVTAIGPPAARMALVDANDVVSVASNATAAPAVIVAVKVAPFFATDLVVTAGFQIYRKSGADLVVDGPHNTTNIAAVPNVVNGYCALLDSSMLTLDADGSYRGVIVWDSGGVSPFYLADEFYVAPNHFGLDLTQVVPQTNTAGTVGDALNAARAQGFGKWVKSETTLTLYAPDGVTPVRVFTLDDANAPTQRS